MSQKTLLAAEIVRRLPDLAKECPENAERVISGLMDEHEKFYGKETKNLRDEFAIAALSTFLNLPDCNAKLTDSAKTISLSVARDCYIVANAMLEARKK